MPAKEPKFVAIDWRGRIVLVGKVMIRAKRYEVLQVVIRWVVVDVMNLRSDRSTDRTAMIEFLHQSFFNCLCDRNPLFFRHAPDPVAIPVTKNRTTPA